MTEVVDSMVDQAAAQLREGDLHAAVEGFSACLAIAPREMRALSGRARAFFQLKQWSEAIGDYSAARDADPEDPQNWVGLGMSLGMANQVYPAISVFEKLLEKKPGYGMGHIQFGFLYLRIGVIGKAREQFQKALACKLSLKDRRQVESILSEQSKLDRNRYYRPDFVELRRRNPGFNFWELLHRIKSHFR